MPGPIRNREKRSGLPPDQFMEASERVQELALILPAPEYEIFCFIWGRTHAWGNMLEEISQRDFLEGVFRRGTQIQPPVRQTALELQANIEHLARWGVIGRIYREGTAYYSIRFDWDGCVGGHTATATS